MKSFFQFQDNEWSPIQIFFAIFIAFSFSVAVRYIWVNDFKDYESFKWLNQIMINTNDGYYFAEGARDIIAGEHQEKDLSPITSPLSKVTATLSKILPASFETIILWLPAFFGSLLVVPLILIGQTIKQPMIGFIGALIASITWSYYNRTMAGYYDTDMLTIVFPTFILWSIIHNLSTKKNLYILLAPVSIILYNNWYGSSYSLNIAMVGFTTLYILLFDRKDIFNYKFITLLFLSIMPIFMSQEKLGIVFAVFGIIYFFEHKKYIQKINLEKEKKNNNKIIVLADATTEKKLNLNTIIIISAILSIILFIALGGINGIIGSLKSYVFRDIVAVESAKDIQLHFYNVVQTVREAGSIPFETFANRISGHKISFIIASIGIFLMMVRFRFLLLALPMVGLGMLALNSGLRFTVYAVPIYGLGIGFLIHLLTKDINQNIVKFIFISILTGIVLYPNIQHVQQYRVPTVFNKNEVTVLDELKYKAKREDYVVAWWDYGYPIRYYADVKTLVDGGKHSGNVNFPASFALLKGEEESANMSRLAVEYTETNLSAGTIIQNMLKDNNFREPNLFFEYLQRPNLNLIKKTRDVYYYLPYRMLNILPTVGLFSQIDLLTGKQAIKPFFYQTSDFKDNGKIIDLGNGITFDKITGFLKIGNVQKPIESFIVTSYNNSNNGQLNVQKLLARRGANLNIIFMKSYGKILIVDNYLLNSTYIKLFVLEQYNKELFEPMIMTPLAKVYRLKK